MPWRRFGSPLIKRKSQRQQKENSYIIGYMDKNKKGEMVFKIRLKGAEGKDIRKIKRGFVCHQISNKNIILFFQDSTLLFCFT